MKVRPILFALAAAAAFTAAGQAAAQTPGGQRDCFYSGNVNGFTAVDNETVNIRVGVREVYQLKLFAPSTEIKWAQGIALVSRGGSFICSRLDADVVVPSTVGGTQRFPITSIRHLTREEAAALPKNQRP